VSWHRVRYDDDVCEVTAFWTITLVDPGGGEWRTRRYSLRQRGSGDS